MSDRMKSSLPDDTGLEPQNDLFRPFPRDVFPTPLARFVEAQAASLNCDEANVALPVLSALASAIGATRRIRIKRNWIEPAVLWTAVVSNRGVRTGQQNIVGRPALHHVDGEVFALRRRDEEKRHLRMQGPGEAERGGSVKTWYSGVGENEAEAFLAEGCEKLLTRLDALGLAQNAGLSERGIDQFRVCRVALKMDESQRLSHRLHRDGVRWTGRLPGWFFRGAVR